MKIQDFIPEQDEILFVAGKRGSGKTTFVRKIIKEVSKTTPVVVFDTKNEWETDPLHLQISGKAHVYTFTRFHLRTKLKPGIYIYKPSYPENRDKLAARIFYYCYKHEDIMVVIHELGDFSSGPNPIPALGQLFRKGRANNVRMSVESQRPAGIPLLGITEAQKVACFYLKKLADRERMAQEVDPVMIKPATYNKTQHIHDFWWRDDTKQITAYVMQGGKNGRTASALSGSVAT